MVPALPGAIHRIFPRQRIMTSFKDMKLLDEAIVRLYLRTSSLDSGNRLMDRNMASRHQIRCDYGGAPRDAHKTVNQNAASAVQGIQDEVTCVRKVDEDVIVFRVLHRYNQVVRP